MQRFVFTFASAIFFILNTTNVGVSQPPTLDEVIAGFKKTESLFFDSPNFVITCERVRSEDVTPSKFGGNWINTEFVVAKNQSSWYTHKRFTQIFKKDINGRNVFIDKDGGAIHFSLEPVVTVIEKGKLLEWRVEDMMLYVYDIGEGRNVHQNVDYFRQMGLNVSKFIMNSGGVDIKSIESKGNLLDYLDHPFFPDFIEKNQDKYHILPNQEEIDGHLCWIVEYPGMDKCWVDSEIGFAIRQRIYHFKPGAPRCNEFHNSDFREVKPGLWIPYKQAVIKYAHIDIENPTIWDKVVSRLYYEVKNANFDSPPTELFDLSIPIGTLVTDGLHNIQYRVSDETKDPFEDPIKRGIGVLKARERTAMWRFIGVVAINICIILFIWFRLRAKAGQNPNNEKGDDKTEK